ncbi:c-type cytochrome, partial [Burkholderia latens]|uniref:c-type cytochrome n=1 Tax=Burkholderia latens TaxID=488446 RepID=UPI00201288D7
PPFAQSLSNQEVAAVVTYIRMSWGNNGTPISPQQVSDLRSAPLCFFCDASSPRGPREASPIIKLKSGIYVFRISRPGRTAR